MHHLLNETMSEACKVGFATYSINGCWLLFCSTTRIGFSRSFHEYLNPDHMWLDICDLQHHESKLDECLLVASLISKLVCSQGYHVGRDGWEKLSEDEVRELCYCFFCLNLSVIF
ncbi:hypothetical protein Droror1_Dr00007074 [Drosera rotundifolia]